MTLYWLARAAAEARYAIELANYVSWSLVIAGLVGCVLGAVHVYRKGRE